MRIAAAFLAPFLAPFLAVPLLADDGASSISVGGLVAMREPRITMAKEVLVISLKKVVVDYDFRNDTDQPVTTEVAFPIPAYTLDPEEPDPMLAGFDDFKLAIGGKPSAFQTEIKAVVKGKDVSAILRRYGVDIATFGHAGDGEDYEDSRDLKKLTPAERQALVAAGAYTVDDKVLVPAWSVEKRYHWTQTFPAKSTVHIHHEYSPVAGAQLVPSELLAPGRKLAPDDKAVVDLVASLCPSPAAVQAIGAHNGMLVTDWVDFILTTANSWKRPIEDFTLIVERTNPQQVVSFCWDGPVQKIDEHHFQAHAANLVPARELRVGYYANQRAQPVK